jgi:3-deoxy-D-manno-octulosonic-acid transferase
VGPHTFNFSQITEDAVAAGAARRVIDAAQMMKEASALLQDAVACSRLSSVAVTLTVEAQGATQRTVDLLAPVIH